MSRYHLTPLRMAFALALAVGAAVGVVHSCRHAPFAQRNVVADTVRQVPAAAGFFKFRGGGFAAPNGTAIASDASSLSGQAATRTLSVSAPSAANGEFVLGMKSTTLATVQLVGAAPRQASVEDGALAYRSAYPGIDVVAVRDPERFELTYILKEPRPFLSVEIALGHIGDGIIAQGLDGALTVKGGNGRPRLRLEQPVAVDAKGTVRLGKYTTVDNILRVALETADLQPPIVLDPAIYIPYWTLIEDDRQPGSATYVPPRGSRETQLALNPQRARTWLIRPVRSQQVEDHSLHLGTLNGTGDFLRVSSLLRPSGTGVPTFAANQLLDWQRTFFTESETWEWSGSRWQLLPQSGLAGLIDPSFAYAPGIAKMVAFGGATPEFTCNAGQENGDWTYCSPDLQSFADATSVFENGGTGWVKKGLPGAPAPRLRASMSTFGAGVLLFGGRAMKLNSPKQVYFGELPFPDSLATDLINDTWVYDGAFWKPVAASNPPPAQEAAQLIYDTRRRRAVLIGGNSLARPEGVSPPTLGLDSFSLWEFDGSDWIQRFEPGDTRLPVTFRKRRGVAAVWHPVRQTTILFGGFVDVLNACPFAGTVLDAKRADTSAANIAALTSQGCIPGYAHDAWEWDGTTLKQLTQVTAGGIESIRTLKATIGSANVPEQVYRQVSGALPGPGALGTDNLAGRSDSHLWPWRYDASGKHYPLRSALERAYMPLAASAPIRKDAGAAQVSAGTSQTMVSPLFAASTVPQLSFDPGTGRILVFPGRDGRVFDTDLLTWVDRTPSSTPFDAGQNDFFGATWDVARQRVVLFDPKTGLTWEHADNASWTRPSVSGSPGAWPVDTTIVSARELDEAGLLQLPKMSYDRARARTTMIYRDKVWEYDGTSWVQRALPAALVGCTAATMMTFDGRRNRTVVVGCTSSPAQTWEWDGSAWYGPFASPFVEQIRRGDDSQVVGGSTLPFPVNQRWQGTLQLPWAHPNALFESASLGGVGTIDAGVLTVWDGTSWKSSAGIPEGHFSDAAEQIFFAPSSIGNVFKYGLPFDPGYYLNDYGYVPNTFFPPVVEDYGANRLLAFRDGVRGLRALSLGESQEQRRWEAAQVGWPDPTSFGLTAGPPRVYPHPFELLAAEQIGGRARANQNVRTDWDGNPKSSGFPSSDETVTNLFWPFRLLSDPVNRRIRILTHRGAFWELGAEQVHGTGEACLTKGDCDNESCISGVCCFDDCSGLCQTCNGSNPGHCQTMPAHSICQSAKCSSGIITTNAECSAVAQCAYTGPSQACPGDLSCADAASCKTHCTTSADCQDPSMTCSSDGTACVPTTTCHDGALYGSSGTKLSNCPGNLACASATSCRTQCTVRSNCADSIATCAPNGSACIGDHITEVASTFGVVPTTWKPKIQRKRADIVASLLANGYTPDEQGRFILRGINGAGLNLAFDPNLYDPTTGLRSCSTRIDVCFEATNNLDSCVAGAPRCESSTPWKNDPGGEDCCPESCLLEYFDKRKTMSSGAALMSVVRGTCYPGMQALLQGKQP